MIKGGGWTISAMAVLAIAGSVWADMMPIPGGETGMGNGCAAPVRDSLPFGPLESLLTWPVPEVTSPALDEPMGPGAEEAAEEPLRSICIDHSNSLDWCLYGLVSLGLLRSGQWVRRPSRDWIGEWSRGIAAPSGGCDCGQGDVVSFLGIGHVVSLARGVDADMSRQCRGEVAFVRRCSSFVVSVLAARAPPDPASTRNITGSVSDTRSHGQKRRRGIRTGV